MAFPYSTQSAPNVPSMINIPRRDFFRLPESMRAVVAEGVQVLATIQGRAVFVPARLI